jgi:SnoaL-like protein
MEASMSPRPSCTRFLATLAMCMPSAGLADAVAEWAEQYREGSALTQFDAYRTLYRTTTDRHFVAQRQVRHGDAVVVLYEGSLTLRETGQRVEERGIAVFYLKDEKVAAVDTTLVDEEAFDLAVAGQAADVASTAIALAAGFAEANPLFAGATSPAGLLGMLALKVGYANHANDASMQECIDAKRWASIFGWAAAGWNLGLLAAGPAGGLVAGGIAAWTTSGRSPAVRSCAMHRLARGPLPQSVADGPLPVVEGVGGR